MRRAQVSENVIVVNQLGYLMCRIERKWTTVDLVDYQYQHLCRDLVCIEVHQVEGLCSMVEREPR